MASDVVFCQTDLKLCDVLDITQTIVFPEPGKPRLITLLGERHRMGEEYLEDDYSERSTPGEFSITDYVMNTLQTNPASIVVLEQSPDATMESIRQEKGSATLREIPFQVTSSNLKDRMVFVDWRKTICPEPQLISLASRSNLFDVFKQSYLPPDQLDKLVYQVSCLKAFVRQKQNLPDLPEPSQRVLNEMEDAIKEQFLLAQPGIDEYKVRYSEGTLTEKWIQDEVSFPLREAWALVMDYFALREALKPSDPAKTPVDEIIIVAGAAHTTMVASFLDLVPGSKQVTELSGDWDPNAKSCISLYKTVAVNAETCNRLASLAQPKARPLYGAHRYPQMPGK